MEVTSAALRVPGNLVMELLLISDITGHEAELWKIAESQRDSVDANARRHVALGAIFLLASRPESLLLKLISGELAARDAVYIFANIPCDATGVPA